MAEPVAASPAFPFGLAALSRLDARQKLMALAMVALAVALLIGAWLWTREPPYGVLFSNLSDQDGGQIVAALQQQNIPYKISEGGGAILVPVGQVHEARLKLASQGLPKGGLVGFELMENQKLGISQFAEQINYQRGLEGELARSIQALGAVRAARVHLAIPKQTAFLRDDLKPSASVLVSLQPGRTLEPAQIAGIVHLVSSSVPQLSPANVSVIDQDGKLISQRLDGFRNDNLNPSQLGYVREVEAQYVKRIETILEPLLGKGNFRTQVAAEIDFSQVEQVEESYQPNPNPRTAIRSQQTSESGAGNPPALGVPGALTNQPPVPATAPITTPPVAGATAAGGAAAGNYTRNATINYELDKTVRHTRATPGAVKRLSVAVAVNHKRPLDKDGKPGKAVPPSAEELKRINDLVRESIGFDEKRGDTINVAAANFVQAEPEAIPELPLWKDPALIGFVREMLPYLGFILVALFVWIKLVKPVIEMFKAAAVAEKAASEENLATEPSVGGEAPLGPHPPTLDERLQKARELAQQEPKLVAEMVKEWMGAGT
ncbi:flagellar basal-body MS-ring/collar protein FliF [Sulfuricystis multivorans]|uniref:flagellar basal-body MS-ring/collar protein FliF n=1 Tax=Sulfuricystis multivorans TaxID=2211108 RepID=UPI000F8342A4|nr:flagellar basal-body MS-ring/collar protein FliF [Sulfuricystis multivorans]